MSLGRERYGYERSVLCWVCECDSTCLLEVIRLCTSLLETLLYIVNLREVVCTRFDLANFCDTRLPEAQT